MPWPFTPPNVLLLGGLNESYGPGYYGDRPTLGQFGKYNPGDNPPYRFYSAGLHEFAEKPAQPVVYYTRQGTPAQWQHRGRVNALRGLSAGASAPHYVYAGPGASQPFWPPDGSRGSLSGILDTAAAALRTPNVLVFAGIAVGVIAAVAYLQKPKRKR